MVRIDRRNQRLAAEIARCGRDFFHTTIIFDSSNRSIPFRKDGMCSCTVGMGKNKFTKTDVRERLLFFTSS